LVLLLLAAQTNAADMADVVNMINAHVSLVGLVLIAASASVNKAWLGQMVMNTILMVGLSAPTVVLATAQLASANALPSMKVLRVNAALAPTLAVDMVHANMLMKSA